MAAPLQAGQLNTQLADTIKAKEAAKADAEKERARADAAETGLEEKLAGLLQQVDTLNAKVRIIYVTVSGDGCFTRFRVYGFA